MVLLLGVVVFDIGVIESLVSFGLYVILLKNGISFILVCCMIGLVDGI